MATQAQDPILTENEEVRQLKEGYKYGWSDATNYVEKPKRGLSHEVIDQISDRKLVSKSIPERSAPHEGIGRRRK